MRSLIASNNKHKPEQYLSLEEGRTLVRLARQAIVSYLKDQTTIRPTNITEKLGRKSGVFVTLNRTSPRELRGCIGFPYPETPLANATIKAAIYAATEDPRFPQVSQPEFNTGITIEVTVLTPPRVLDEQDRAKLPDLVEVGRHGLIIEGHGTSGLLLPQVATEWNWDSTEFLTNCCLKANLPPDSWLLEGTTVKVYEGEIFEEVEPAGEVRKKTGG